MMIDPSSVSLDGRATSIRDAKSQRSNLSYRLSAEDEKRVALQQMREAQQEKDRVKRLQVYDQRHGQAYEKIHSMLLR
jgi:hypothetical protein